MDTELLTRVVYSLLSLYMMVILLRWLAPWLNIDLERHKWIRLLTDPFISRVRAVLPNLGPVDFSAVVALLMVWLVRSMAVQMLVGR